MSAECLKDMDEIIQYELSFLLTIDKAADGARLQRQPSRLGVGGRKYVYVLHHTDMNSFLFVFLFFWFAGEQ